MTERRYRDDEVRKIFKLATTQQPRDLPSSTAVDGLTLADIQSIGSEVGLEPDAVARAAHALDTAPPQSLRKSFGMPIEVQHAVPLPRVMTDLEWEQLVVELRQTFRAKGRISAHGSLREWVNGNLHVASEPTESGSRLSLTTVKGDAPEINAIGAVAVAGAAVSLGFALVAETVTPFLMPLGLGATASGIFVMNSIRLSRWRQRRAQQMQQIGAKIKAIMGG